MRAFPSAFFQAVASAPINAAVGTGGNFYAPVRIVP